MSDNKSIKTTGSSIETRLLSVRTYKTDLQEYLASFKRTLFVSVAIGVTGLVYILIVL